MSIEAIKKVAAFADTGSSSFGAGWECVTFHPGEVFAGGAKGSVRAATSYGFDCRVPANKIVRAIKAMRGEPELSVKGSQLVIKSGKAAARLQISGGKEPSLPRPVDITWAECPLLCQADRVSWAVHPEESHRNLAGVHLGADGIKASNGHVFVKLGGLDFSDVIGPPCGIPAQMLKGVPETARIGRILSGDWADRRVFVADDESGELYRACSVYDEAFPPMDDILTEVVKMPSATVVRGELLDLIKRSKLSTEMLEISVAGTRLSMGADLGREGTLFSFLDSVELIDSKIPDLKIGIDTRYLLPLIDHCAGDQLEIRMIDGLNPLYVRDGEYVGVVMPFRL